MIIVDKYGEVQDYYTVQIIEDDPMLGQVAREIIVLGSMEDQEDVPWQTTSYLS